MIRQPTPDAVSLAWWTRAVAGLPVDRHDGLPECGFFKRRWIKDGPWVPARIFIESNVCPITGELVADEVMRIEVDGEFSNDPSRHWTYLRPISKPEYDGLLRLREELPVMAATHAKVDIYSTPMRP